MTTRGKKGSTKAPHRESGVLVGSLRIFYKGVPGRIVNNHGERQLALCARAHESESRDNERDLGANLL